MSSFHNVYVHLHSAFNIGKYPVDKHLGYMGMSRDIYVIPCPGVIRNENDLFKRLEELVTEFAERNTVQTRYDASPHRSVKLIQNADGKIDQSGLI